MSTKRSNQAVWNAIAAGGVAAAIAGTLLTLHHSSQQEADDVLHAPIRSRSGRTIAQAGSQNASMNGRILFKIHAQSNPTLQTSLITQLLNNLRNQVDPNATIESLIPGTLYYLARMSSVQHVNNGLNSLRASSQVQYAEADRFMYANFGRLFRRWRSSPTPTPTSTSTSTPTPTGTSTSSPTPSPTSTNTGGPIGYPNDPDLVKQWHYAPVGQGGSLYGAKVHELWQKGITGSSSFIIAVLDTGIDLNHNDLKHNLYQNSKEVSGLNGLDDDLNGYIDDKNGWNFVGNNNNPNDDHGHGTHVAGIAGARGHNQLGVAGAMWNVQLMALKTLDSEGRGNGSDAVRAIDYASKMGAKIINCSWGSYTYLQTMKEIIDLAGTRGSLVVASAGNETQNTDTTPHYPSSYTSANIISVAASTSLGQLAVYSNYGAQSVHVAAPGSTIYSTLRNQGYGNLSGTSMAAPVVSGVAGLVWYANPTLTYTQLKNRIMNCSQLLVTGRDRVKSGGIVNAWNTYYSSGCR